VRLLPPWLVSMSIVLRHFSHLHSSDSPVLPASQATSATAKVPGSSRAAPRASSVEGNSKKRATSPITSQGDARATSRPLAGINEHCATSLLSLSFFQVHRILQHPRQQAPLMNGSALLVWRRLAHRQWRVTPKTVLRHPVLSMSIVLRHLSHFHCATSPLSTHSFRFSGYCNGAIIFTQ
jgi:hypothetical protein